MADLTPKRTKGFRYRPTQKATPTAHRSCVVYFVSTEDVPDFPIKIGVAFDSVEKRVKSLQTAAPYRLCVLATVEATTSYEWILHKELHKHRLCGEWFRRSPEVLAEIQSAKILQRQCDEKRRLSDEAWNNLPATLRQKLIKERSA